jgi:hypothetical protein
MRHRRRCGGNARREPVRRILLAVPAEFFRLLTPLRMGFLPASALRRGQWRRYFLQPICGPTAGWMD